MCKPLLTACLKMTSAKCGIGIHHKNYPRLDCSSARVNKTGHSSLTVSGLLSSSFIGGSAAGACFRFFPSVIRRDHEHIRHGKAFWRTYFGALRTETAAVVVYGNLF